MCGRYALFSPGQEIARWFGVAGTPDLSPRFNIAPRQTVHAVIRGAAGGRAFKTLRWGFTPHWAADPDRGAMPINARVETVADKPAFRDAFRRRRCLLPANGFYEWKRENGAKQPWYMESAAGPFLALAGIWTRWSGGEGGRVIESCAILTTEARGRVCEIHPRMPLLVPPDRFEGWLGEERGSTADLTGYTWTHPVSARPVSRIVNSPAVDDPACLNPASDEGATEQLF